MADPASFRTLTVEQFVDVLASPQPVPGGGSASAIAASLAAALVEMVASLSEGRPKYAVHAALHAEASAAGTRLRDRLLAIADEDAAAYTKFTTALRMPRDTEAEIEARERALQAAAREASEVPMACVDACLEVVIHAEALAGRCNQNAASDLEVAALLAQAAATGAAANVLVNLPAVGDPSFAGEMTARVKAVLDDVERTAETTRRRVRRGGLREPLAGPVIASA